MKSKAPSGLFDVVRLYSGRPLDVVCGQQRVGMKSKAPSGLFDDVRLYSGRPLDCTVDDPWTNSVDSREWI